MASEFPSTRDIRAGYRRGESVLAGHDAPGGPRGPYESPQQLYAEFDGWLAEHDRETEARALEALADRWEHALSVFDYVADDDDREQTQMWSQSARDHARMIRAGEIAPLAPESPVHGKDQTNP